jgi:hypothetical protein
VGALTHCARLLEVLSDRQPHDHHELYSLGMIVHSRIADLRKRGYEIAQWSVRENGHTLYLYQLVGEPLSSPDLSVSSSGHEAGSRDGRSGDESEQPSLFEVPSARPAWS